MLLRSERLIKTINGTNHFFFIDLLKLSACCDYCDVHSYKIDMPTPFHRCVGGIIYSMNSGFVYANLGNLTQVSGGCG